MLLVAVHLQPHDGSCAIQPSPSVKQPRASLPTQMLKTNAPHTATLDLRDGFMFPPRPDVGGGLSRDASGHALASATCRAKARCGYEQRLGFLEADSVAQRWMQPGRQLHLEPDLRRPGQHLDGEPFCEQGRPRRAGPDQKALNRRCLSRFWASTSTTAASGSTGRSSGICKCAAKPIRVYALPALPQ